MTLVEPVGYSTDWAGPSSKTAEPNPAYEHVREARRKRVGGFTHPGDPAATGPVILQLVDMENPPLRIFFGSWAGMAIRREYQKRLKEWDTYQKLSTEAYGSLR